MHNEIAMEELWFCVDERGFELCSNLKPSRFVDIASSLKREFNPMYYPTWVTDCAYHDYSGAYQFDFNGCFIPRGTIEKLTGKIITYQDEPIKIEFENDEIYS